MRDPEDYIISSEIQFQIDRISEKLFRMGKLTEDKKIHTEIELIIDMLDDLAWMERK